MTRKSTSQKDNPEKEPIAIIGIGCRFPGGVKDPQTFWQLLVNGIDAISDIPADRAEVAPLYDPNTGAPGKIASSQGGFLDKLDQFDASFFGVSPREAEFMDPQQRLLLETSWEALEDAGQTLERLRESQTSVFVGMWSNDYTEKMYKEIEDINLYVITGGGRYAASGRLSYFFGFQGPSLTVDTACSSSLVTVHLACHSLREGESTLALAGGVNLILEPAISVGYSRSKMLSPDGRSKFGDIRANGYVRSEGVGMVVLKRLSNAIADNDRIYAVIRGSAVNNDGRSSELLVAPGVGSQVKMLREAYRNAGVDPCEVGYVEAHGTGTPIGDPVELEALGTVLSENRDTSRPVRVGSIKTNIGHTEAASGVAGLIKTALCLHHKAIPPSLHFKDPNPKIPWKDLKLEMQTELTPWPYSDATAIAAVNSFGITGTNAHLVLAEASQLDQEKSNGDQTSTHLLPLSAQTPEALKMLAKSYITFFGEEEKASIYDLCFTAACRRTHHTKRLAFTGKSRQELMDQISSYLTQATGANRSKIIGKPKVAFVFPGQGSQSLGMGRELLKQNSVFAEVLNLCDHAISHWSNWSLLEQLALDEDAPGYRMNEIGVIQPTLFAMEVALAAVWRSWGIEPAAVIGHSMGEVAAAYVAGALSLEDATRIICKRSQLMQRTSGQGGMAVIGLPYDEVEKLVDGYEEKLSIAVQNSPKSTVISGSPDALEILMEDLQAREIFCRLVKVDVASHSPQMDAIRPELVESLNGIHPRSSGIPFYSTVTQDIREGGSLDAEYWGQNLRQPVRFGQTVARLLEDEHLIFIEMSPHPILLSTIEETRSEANKPAYGFASLRRDQPELTSLLTELGSLYSLGFDVDWIKLYPDSGNVVSLPTYPWQRERYWFETTLSSGQTRPGANPLLGQYFHSATGQHIWETSINTKRFPYLNDHQVRGSVVLPAAAYVEMILAAASEVYGSKANQIRDISFKEAFILSAKAERTIQLILHAEIAEGAEFHFYSQTEQTDSPDSWTLHASGTLEPARDTSVDESVSRNDYPSHQGVITADEFYNNAITRGLEYGSSFQTIIQTQQISEGLIARIKFPEDLVAYTAKYLLHPVLIDACFQALLAELPESNEDTYLPTSIDAVQFHTSPGFDQEFWCRVTRIAIEPEVAGDLVLFSESGQMILSVHGLHFQRVKGQEADVHDLLYEIKWRESAIPFQDQTESRHWLIFADRQGTGGSLAEYLQQESQTCTLVYAGNAYRSLDDGTYQLDPRQPDHFQQLLKEVVHPIHHILHLWSLDSEPVPSDTDPALTGILYLTQAITQLEWTISPRLWLATRGTQTVLPQPEPVSVSQSPVWGMGAVIANEIPNLRCTRVDLNPTAGEGEIELLARTLLSAEDDDQLALRNRQRYVARLKRYQAAAGNEARTFIQQKIEKGQSFQVQVKTPGILDDLSITLIHRKSYKTGEIEISVKATGLNFMNVMSAMGIYPGYPHGVGPLGIECAGIVSGVGEGVTGFQVGDEVVAIAFDSLASHAVTDARLAVKKPASMSFEEAATIPIAYVTAYYALYSLGRLQAGERVLIHSATGGVGLAAIQLAKRAGAEIFATAGSDEKRKLLREMGIKHALDSRSLVFAQEILKETNGEGVDLVLNSLAGKAITKGLEILKPYGRFLEIGKRDIYKDSKVGLLPFQKNLSYSAIDLDKMSRERPDTVGRMLREVFDLIESKEITPLPLQSYPVSKASDAFHLMAQAKHIGKIVISLEDADASIELPPGAAAIRSDATYLITGGLGDLGLAFAQTLARQGARHFVLLGRRKSSEIAQKSIDELISADIEVLSAQADVTDMGQLSALFKQIKETMPPLCGVIHAAGLLADATVHQMDRERFKLAYEPKVLGAWNLHLLTFDQPLDFFILFSSVAATLGTPGQVNYAAGNAFLDALARFRHAQNLPALSINWGPWSEIGLAASQENRGNRLQQQGLKSISPAQGLEAMSVLMGQGISQISVMQLNAKRWCEIQPAAMRSGFFKELLDQISAGTGVVKAARKNIREEVLSVQSGKQRRTVFESHIREQVAHVLRLASARIPLDKPLRALGLDSLMSIELRNRLEDTLNVTLPATVVWNYPTLNALTSFLEGKMDIPFETANQMNETVQANASHPTAVDERTAADIDQLSKTELDALLLEELNSMEDLLRGNDNEQRS